MARQRIKLYRHLPLRLPKLSWPVIFVFWGIFGVALILEQTSVLTAEDMKAIGLCGILVGLGSIIITLLDWMLDALDDGVPSKFKLSTLDKLFIKYLQTIDPYEITMFSEWIENRVRFVTHFYTDTIGDCKEEGAFRAHINETETGQMTVSLIGKYVVDILYKNTEYLPRLDIKHESRVEKYYINSLPVLFLLWLKVENKYDKILITLPDVIYQPKPSGNPNDITMDTGKLKIKQYVKAGNGSTVVQAAVVNSYNVAGCGSSTIDNYNAGWGAGSSCDSCKVYASKSIIKEDGQHIIDIKNIIPVPLSKCEFVTCIVFANKIMLIPEKDFIVDKYAETLIILPPMYLPKDTVIGMTITYKEK